MTEKTILIIKKNKAIYNKNAGKTLRLRLFCHKSVRNRRHDRTGNSLCATVSVKTHRPGIPCRHDGKGMKQGDEGGLYWRRNKHWGGTTVERQLRENGAEACRSSSRHEYASFARFWYLAVCQPFMRYNQIKKDLSSRGRARSGTRKSLFDTTGKAFPAAGRVSFVHRKSGSRPSENFFQAHHAKETVIWNNKNSIASG